MILIQILKKLIKRKTKKIKSKMLIITKIMNKFQKIKKIRKTKKIKKKLRRKKMKKKKKK